ncbi:hypothetical protein B0T36_17790 [Nocardia donostiensis]|uniref:hypothetical protein n=1 Tax=Nocardia donostiensis TaxID=1538463 RepID=UPI0009D9C387|nr:hypothetical protein [Nocardia donostiensis]OQS13957.1 hypothetical protein B0T36_17790 [Nocardia donostiensis]
MGGTRRSRSLGKIAVVITRIGALLAEGLLRRELLVGAVLLSSFTVVMGLTSDGAAWKAGYCAAGGLGIAASFVVMRREWRWQWLGSVGICLFNVILLVVHGRLSGQI